ncbi:DEAD/DEAH box helicase [Bacillus sp. PS06]|uniref:DEAD/DEAH box helicase n=1 Tax=Bacillus sp. PS06 TaxID=2764176 RepID=UPI00177F2334|nr:DEAD/DEAH box helicase [Bacillus sp. PS06]MBD8070191.1 DEAD/DEAH box helicase [Bacillus sp. PS06]
MNIRVNKKMIEEMCGSVSLKRGEAFYRSNKVSFEEHDSNYCQAVVSGIEDFYVKVEKIESSRFIATCTCPKLGSFQKDCQHIAAVLLSIHEHQLKETESVNRIEKKSELKATKGPTNDWLTLFDDKQVRKSVQQRYFENRTILDIEFKCSPIILSKNNQMIGIELRVEGTAVNNISHFLENLNENREIVLSDTLIFNPNLYCFDRESDVILQQLAQVSHDHSINSQSEAGSSSNILLLPPSLWLRFMPLLSNAQHIKLEYDGKIFDQIQFTNNLLPLHFSFSKKETHGYQLWILGLNDLLVFQAYHSVLLEDTFYHIEADDFRRLLELKQMLDQAGSTHLPITKEQVGFFLEKVVPGLRKLGVVEISKEISAQMVKTPLTAKLFLDRVKNRLLAGLEFQYENIVINPLDEKQTNGPLLFRDKEKEAEILELMNKSLFSTTDGGYFIHNEELEYEFLYNIVPKLHKLVQIYATTAVRNRVFRGNPSPKIRVKVQKERTNWLEFKFEMDGIPEQHIREILQALEEKRKYYRLKEGALLSLETKEFEEINRFLHALPVQSDDLEAGLNLPFVQGFQLLNDGEDNRIFTFEDSFQQFIDEISHPPKADYKVPQRLDTVLRNYQKHGFRWMKSLAKHGFGGILADDMGLGKTLQSISFIVSELKEIREKEKAILVVCPSSLTYNWLSELIKFAPEVEAIVIDGNKQERSHLQQDVSAIDVIITSYPLLRKDVAWYEKQLFHTVFFDEAQAFKNPITQTARAVKRIKAEHKFALTGTPVENSIEELWSIFHVVFPELFQGLKEYSHLSRKTVARRSRPFLLRRVKEDVLEELPQKLERIEAVELMPDQKKLYAAYLAKLRHDTLKHLDKDTIRKNRIKILAGITRLRQICCHPSLFVEGYKGKSAKFEQLMKILKEAKHSGRRVLIFSQFTKMLDLIGNELAIQETPFFYLDGQTPSEERVDLCNRFNAGEREVFLISLKAGGTGLNVTGADTVILYDIWWNPAVEEQATARAHRMGQTKVVEVIKLITTGTVEEKMNELQDKKRDLVSELIESSNQSSSSLTEEDIRDILKIE